MSSVRIDHAGIEVTCLPTGRWASNCYVVADISTFDAVVIDPGDDPGRLIAAIDGYKVAHVVCTHGHYDHLGAARELCEHLDLPCQLHVRDAHLATLAPLYARRFDRIAVVPPRAIGLLQDDATLFFGAHALNVLPAPGHTPGSICLSTGTALFTGDAIMRERFGRTDLPGGDAAALAASVDRILSAADDLAIVFPGHGPTWTAAAAKQWLRAKSAR